MKELIQYFFRGTKPEHKKNYSIRGMHFVNKLSIVMFLFALGVMVYRWLR